MGGVKYGEMGEATTGKQQRDTRQNQESASPQSYDEHRVGTNGWTHSTLLRLSMSAALPVHAAPFLSSPQSTNKVLLGERGQDLGLLPF